MKKITQFAAATMAYMQGLVEGVVTDVFDVILSDGRMLNKTGVEKLKEVMDKVVLMRDHSPYLRQTTLVLMNRHTRNFYTVKYADIAAAFAVKGMLVVSGLDGRARVLDNIGDFEETFEITCQVSCVHKPFS